MKLNRYFPFSINLIVLFLSCQMPVKAALTDGLILHYDFESISGISVYDASHHNMNGTLMGSPLAITGYSGTGVTFPTVTDYLQMPQGVVNSLTSFSITAWVNINMLNTWSRIFDFGSGTAYNMFLTPISGNNCLRFAIKNGGGEEQINAANALKTNEWVHVAVTYVWNTQTAVGSGKLLVNGMLAGTNDAFSINPSMLPLTTQNYIAKSQYNDPALNGTVDDFRIYERALTDAEILELNGFPANLIEVYNSISIVGDLTKVTNNLTLPTMTGTGGYPVTWSSSSPDVIGTDGTVTRPKYYDQTVTLTATITVMRDGQSVNLTKEFSVTVLASESNHWTNNLPLILINTNGQGIIQNTKIMADMKVLNSSSGANYIQDTIFEYNGKIGIEIRGFTSAGFPKKSYSVETRVDSDTSLNVHLLGMPKENDWVLNGPYPDKSLMRNVLAYHLGNLTGKWSPRTRYFELYLNGTYQGLYILIEKIKVDKNRLDLATLKAEDTTGDEVTGGYILKIDRPETTDVDSMDYWISPYLAWTTLKQRVFFLFHDPKGEDLNVSQHAYIQKHITDFEDAMYSDDYQDKVNGFYPLVDLNSFLDYYIINELARNLDGYRISTFIHKDKDSKGGKITMGPYWDYDICFGNANFFSAGVPEGWIIDGMGNADSYAMPFWWQKFRVDPYFNAQLKTRWNEWTGKYINSTYLNQFIDSCAYELIDAQKRNFQTWNILSTWVWPNNYVGGTYANEVSYLKNWLNKRMTWMDSQIQAIQDLPDNLTPERFPMDLVTYPNPFAEQVNFKFYLTSAGKFELRIFDLLGRNVYTNEENLESGMHELPVSASELGAQSSVYVYQVKVNGKVKKSGKLIRFEK